MRNLIGAAVATGARSSSSNHRRIAVGLVVAGPLFLASCNWMAVVAQVDPLTSLDVNLDSVTVSADGLHVAYESVFRPDPLGSSVAVRDLATGSESYIGNADSPSLTDDGHLVAYTYWSRERVPTQVYVHNQRNGTDVLISANLSGAPANRWSSQPAFSGDGTRTAFASSSTDLVVGVSVGQYDVYVRANLSPKSTVRASVDTSGGEPDAPSFGPAMDRSGRYVAFESSASNLVAGDQNGASDVFLRDLVTNTTTRVSISSPGGDPDGASQTASVSGNGRYVAFTSSATNLVPGDTNGAGDVFVRDVVTGTTRRVSIGADGAQADSGSASPSISEDGSSVAFSSSATNLVPGDTNGVADVFVRDLTHGTTTRVSLDPLGRQGNGDSFAPGLSGDGTIVAFASRATNLAQSDIDSPQFVFARAVSAPTVTRITPAGAAAGSTLTVTIDGTGFTSASTVLDPDASNGFAVIATTFISTSQLKASISIDGAADPGPRSLLVETPGPGPGLLPGSFGSCQCFTVT